MTVHVAPYRHAFDSSQVHALHQRVRDWQLATREVEVFGDDNDDLLDVPRNYLLPGGLFLVAWDDVTGGVVGIIGLKRTGPYSGDVKRFAVHPDWHRQGIGRALLGALIDHARAAMFTTLDLFTGEQRNARGLYESAGFQVIGWDERFRDHHMRLTVPTRSVVHA